MHYEAKGCFCSGNLRKQEPCSPFYSPALWFENLRQHLDPWLCLQASCACSPCFGCLFSNRDQSLSAIMPNEEWLTYLLGLIWSNFLSLAKQYTAPSHTLQLTLGNTATIFSVFSRNSLYTRNSTSTLAAYHRKNWWGWKVNPYNREQQIVVCKQSTMCHQHSTHRCTTSKTQALTEGAKKRVWGEPIAAACTPCNAGSRKPNQAVTCPGPWKECVMPGTEKCHFVWLPHRWCLTVVNRAVSLADPWAQRWSQ